MAVSEGEATQLPSKCAHHGHAQVWVFVRQHACLRRSERSESGASPKTYVQIEYPKPKGLWYYTLTHYRPQASLLRLQFRHELNHPPAVDVGVVVPSIMCAIAHAVSERV